MRGLPEKLARQYAQQAIARSKRGMLGKVAAKVAAKRAKPDQ